MNIARHSKSSSTPFEAKSRYRRVVLQGPARPAVLSSRPELSGFKRRQCYYRA